jgi:hypothetical protein
LNIIIAPAQIIDIIANQDNSVNCIIPIITKPTIVNIIVPTPSETAIKIKTRRIKAPKTAPKVPKYTNPPSVKSAHPDFTNLPS